jgi:hypothetical protein
MSYLLREIVYMYKFIYKTTKRDKSIIFYTEHEGYYPCFGGLIHKLVSEYNHTICYITSSPDDTILKNTNPKVKTFYFDKLLPFFMLFVNCKVFIMTLTDLHNFYLKRSINEAKYVYVFHALVSTHMMYTYNAFDHYDYIFCGGPHQIREIRQHEKLNSLPPKTLIEVGYDRLECIYSEYQRYHKPVSSTRGTILIAPSWGVKNVLESCGEQLVELLLREGYEVIVRPHPETVKRSPQLLERFISRFRDTPTFTLERSVATNDSLLKADILICDCSGIALEYALGTERPVLFIDTPIKVKNSKYQELGTEPLELLLRPKIGVIVPPEQLDTVPGIINELMSNRVLYKERLAILREQNVFNFGHSVDIGAKCIDKVVRQKEHD